MDRKVILLVEDDADDEALTLRALGSRDVADEVVVARDGAEALEWVFAEGRALPAVVMLDLKLPKVDGLEVLRRLRSDPRTKLLPVVVLTSSQEDQDILKSYGLGANGYVRKPVRFEDFAAAVGQLGLYWTLLNETPSVTRGSASRP